MPSDLTQAAQVLDGAISDLQKLRVAAYVDRCRRDQEAVRDLLEQYGERELKMMIERAQEEMRERDDRYLDDPRRGQSAELNRRGEF